MSAVVKLFAPRRRLHRRVPLDVPIAMVHESGTVGTGFGRNMSVSGMQIYCSTVALDSWYKSDVPLREHPAFLDLHFMLPEFKRDAKVDARCRLVYTNDYDENGYLLGLEFEFLPESSRRHVVEYVAGFPQEDEIDY